MTTNTVTLFCLVESAYTFSAFPVEIESTKTVGHLKKLIIAELPASFQQSNANDLRLWQVSIPDGDDNYNHTISLFSSELPKMLELRATIKLSRVFGAKPQENMIHIMVQGPLADAYPIAN
ncbi:hypothetical protein KI688_003215 [Linnemannia hyalina]|uniref:Crinkler effector protein N-terminal domain-containing protein n=1 Tax=Linnemannia hyalina TaxID=64524 RepID=A0A9P7XQS9_9FUNG|nr:hypothetical protein KI688_003215 [Linnemannia hyalina]